MSEALERSSQERRIAEIEGKLTGLLSDIPGVRNVRGCSWKGRDYKVNFFHDSDLPDNVTNSYNLEYKPGEGMLVAVPLGLAYDVPQSVREAISKKFPSALYRQQGRVDGLDGVHSWSNVGEGEM